MTEVWRDIADCLGYQVSNLGRVKSVERTVVDRNGRASRIKQRIRKLRVVRVKGKPSSVRITIYKVSRLVHVLVLNAFKGPCPYGMEGCHNDGHAMHNEISNLRWDTRESNVRDTYRHGARKRSWAGFSIRTMRGKAFVSGYLQGISGLI
jgi:hypothetical protein